MASALLRSARLVTRQQGSRIHHICGCHNYYTIESGDGESSVVCDRRWTHNVSKHSTTSVSNYRAWGSLVSPSCTSVLGSFSNPSAVYTNISHNSKFLHSDSKYRNLSLYQDVLLKRSFHETRQVLKEESVIEKSLKDLKREAAKEKPKPQTLPVPVTGNRFQRTVLKIKDAFNKAITFYRENGMKGCLKALWNMILFYKDGAILLFKDAKLCFPLLIKYLRNGSSSLTRREYKLLKQTLKDLFLMFPYVPAILIPFLDFLIPIMVMTGFAPSGFLSKETKERKLKMKAQMKVESAKLLMESLQNMPLRMKSKQNEQASTLKLFSEFMEKVKSTEVMPPIEDILKFSRLFENSLTLDDLEMEQLRGICKILGINFFSEIPSARALRFQIDLKMRELTVDDKLILRDGIDSLSIEELQAANRARGMISMGVSEERLRIQLQQWLELHLKEQVPTSLLLLSRVMYLDANLTPAEQLKNTISALPDKLVDKAKVTTAETSGEPIDKKTKIKILDEEAKAIKAEKQAAEEERKKEEDEKKKELQERKKKELAELALQMMDQQVIVKEVAQRLHVEEKMRESSEHAARKAEATPVKEEPSTAKKVAEPEIPKPEEKAKPDIAEPIEEKIEHEIEDKAVELSDDEDEGITVKDLADIEKAIEDTALHYKDEMAEVAEDLDEYKEDVEDIKTIDQEKKIEETLNARLLLKQMDKVVKDFDKTINKLQEEKTKIQQSIDKQEEFMLKTDKKEEQTEILELISEKKSNLISVNDVLLSLKKMQNVPDDVRMQKVLQVLDTDRDGLIDINHVLKVTEAVGRENLKLNKEQIKTLMTLIQKENEIEIEEKMKEKEEKGLKEHKEKPEPTKSESVAQK